MSLTINAFDDASRDYLFNLSNIYLKDISCEDIGLFTEITENGDDITCTVSVRAGDLESSSSVTLSIKDNLVIAAISLLLLSLDGFGIETTFSAMAACLNNIGPGFGVCGPAGNFATYSDLSKVVLCLDMLLGRLEIIPFMMLFAPSNWSKG